MRIGVDLGGTKIEAVALSPTGDVLVRQRNATPQGGYDSVIRGIAELVATIEARMGARAPAIGVGIPGSLSPATGLVRNANSTVLIGHPLDHDLAEALGRPVRLSNDANCFALGEKHFGKGQKYDNMVAIAIGTGAGGGIIINNKLHSGLFGGAGEVGHMPYKGGIFETYVGSGFFTKINNTTGKALYDKAMEGDKNAIDLFHEFGRHTGKLIKTILYILAPDAIIIGGSISKSFPLFKAGIHEELADFPFDVMLDVIAIEQSELEDIAILGAAGLYYNA